VKERDDMVVIGRIMKWNPANNFYTVDPMTDVTTRFSVKQNIYVQEHEFRITEVKPAPGKKLFCTFEQGSAQIQPYELVGQMITIPAADSPVLESDHYYHYQLIGLNVFENELCLGEITDILYTGSNDVYVVSKEGKETLIPAITSVIIDVNLESKNMKVTLPKGL
jgi:16S rRNA processing protein RimM